LIQLGNVTSYTDSSLPDGATYYYRVTAFTIAGESTESNEARATTWNIPTAPRSLQGTPATNSVTLNWTPPSSTGGLALTAYRIYEGASSGSEAFLAAVSGTTTTFYETGLPNGVARYYRVSAVNAKGEGPLSTEIKVVPQFPAPSAPLNLTAVPGSMIGEVQLTWSTPASDGGTPITGYNIYRGSGPGTETLLTQVPAGTTQYTDDGLTILTNYYYQVTAINPAESAPSNEACSKPFPWLAALGCIP
jgi:fibronectin type 3 domain-containing protein